MQSADLIGEHSAIITESFFSDAQMDSLLAAADIRQAQGEWAFMPAGPVMLHFGVGRLETVLQLTPVGEGVTTTNADGSTTTQIVQSDLEELQVAGRKVDHRVAEEVRRWIAVPEPRECTAAR